MFPLKAIKEIDEFAMRNEQNCIPTHLSGGGVKIIIMNVIMFNSISIKIAPAQIS